MGDTGKAWKSRPARVCPGFQLHIYSPKSASASAPMNVSGTAWSPMDSPARNPHIYRLEQLPGALQKGDPEAPGQRHAQTDHCYPRTRIEQKPHGPWLAKVSLAAKKCGGDSGAEAGFPGLPCANSTFLTTSHKSTNVELNIYRRIWITLTANCTTLAPLNHRSDNFGSLLNR
jgi:hypothetical protein